MAAALSLASSAAQVGSVSTARQTGRVLKMSPQQPPTPDWMLLVDELKDQVEPAFGCGGCTPGGECGLHCPSSTPGPTASAAASRAPKSSVKARLDVFTIV